MEKTQSTKISHWKNSLKKYPFQKVYVDASSLVKQVTRDLNRERVYGNDARALDKGGMPGRVMIQ